MNEITKTLLELKAVEEKFRKIQENLALYGAENGLSAHEQEVLDKIISLIGAANIAGNEIAKRALNI